MSKTSWTENENINKRGKNAAYVKWYTISDWLRAKNQRWNPVNLTPELLFQGEPVLLHGA